MDPSYGADSMHEYECPLLDGTAAVHDLHWQLQYQLHGTAVAGKMKMRQLFDNLEEKQLDNNQSLNEAAV
jgi:hypothetical protein